MPTRRELTDTLRCRPGEVSAEAARGGHRRSGRRRTLLLACLSVLLPVHAQATCDLSICVGAADTCVISGTHVLDDGCVLDFGSRDVTVAGSATLQSAFPGAAFGIRARDLVVQGLLRAPGAIGEGPSIDVAVARDFRTESVSGSPGTVDVAETVLSGPGWLSVVAAGAVVIAGKHVDADGGPSGIAGLIELMGASIRIAGPVHANASKNSEIEAGWISLYAAEGGVTVIDTIQANGTGNFGWGGGVELYSEGGAVAIIGTASVSVNGSGGGDGGFVDLTATGELSVAGAVTANGSGSEASGGSMVMQGAQVVLHGSLAANAGNRGAAGDVGMLADAGSVTTMLGSTVSVVSSGGGVGGFVDLQASGDVVVNGDVLAAATGVDAEGGFIAVTASPVGMVTINGTLDVTVGNRGVANGSIEIAETCSVLIAGALRARNSSAAGGRNVITYRGSLDVSGGTLLADAIDGGNLIQCRCVSSSAGTCDPPLRCADPPVVTGAQLTPALEVTPIPLADCRCGNGVIEPGEACDQGSATTVGCCSSSCRFQPTGMPCPADQDVCTADVCDGAGTCEHLPVPACFATPTPIATLGATPTTTPASTATPTPTVTRTPTATPTPTVTRTPTVTPTQTVTPTPMRTGTPSTPGAPTPTPTGAALTCASTPDDGCRHPAIPMKALLQVKLRGDDAKNSLVWKWLRGMATGKGEFGDPTARTDYRLCVYDAAGPVQPVLDVLAPGAGTCAGKPCWTETASGYRYRDKTLVPDGVASLKLVEGVEAKAKIMLQGKGANLQLPSSLALVPPLTVQLKNGEGQCWTAVFEEPLRNDVTQFKAKGH